MTCMREGCVVDLADIYALKPNRSEFPKDPSFYNAGTTKPSIISKLSLCTYDIRLISFRCQADGTCSLEEGYCTCFQR